MSSLPRLAVTGATGALGGLVARSLAGLGLEQRLLVRDVARSPDLPGAIPVSMTYGDAVAAREALVGADTLFMVSAAEAADRVDQHRTLVDAAAAAGVRHVVYTSFFAAAPDCVFTLGRDHFATEQHLRSSGMAFTFLRDNFYLDLLPLFADEEGVLRGPAGDGRVSAVARADITRVAVAVLLDRGAHAGASYDLTGREALSLTELAETVTVETGRRLVFHDETIEEAYASRRRWPAEQWQYDAWVSTYTAIASGEVAPISDDVERVTGQAPMTLVELLRSQA